MTLVENALVKPDETQVVRLGDVVEFKYGKSLASSIRTGEGFPVYGSNGVVGFHNQSVTKGSTIIVGRKGSYGQVNYSDGPCWPIDTAYFIDSTCTSADLRWLSHLLPTLGLDGMNKSAAVPGLSRDDAYRIPIQVPPLPEQRRIAAILDKSDQLRTQRREALAYLDALTLSIYGGLQALENHPNIPLTDFLKLSSGKFLPAKKMTEGGAFPVYGGNGVNGFHDEYLVEQRTIVIGRVGAYCGAVHLTSPKSWVTDNALMVRLLRSDVDLNYLTAALKAANLNQYSNRSGQPSISGSKLYPVRIPFPPLELQQTFARRVAGVERLKERHRNQLAELETLFASLQHRAFTGKL